MTVNNGKTTNNSPIHQSIKSDPHHSISCRLQPVTFHWDLTSVQGPRILAWASSWKPFLVQIHLSWFSIPKVKLLHLQNKLLISLSFFLFFFNLMYKLILVMISARWTPGCNRDQHLEGTSHHLSVSSLNWSKSGISVSPNPPIYVPCFH